MINNNLLIILFAIFFCYACGPSAHFTASSTKVTAPEKVHFSNTSKRAISYQWDFGNGDISEETNPKYRYTQSGNYQVTLTAIADGKKSTATQNIQVIAPNKCLIEIRTSKGVMIAELYDDTPLHQKNFLKLVDKGYYDSLLFHRVIPGFMIQGGDPDSKNALKGKALGMGGPNYQISHEIIPEHIHIRGALAAARTNNPQKKSSGSQFYIVDGREVTAQELERTVVNRSMPYSPEQISAYESQGGTPSLDGLYTVFGRVFEGLEVIDRIAEVQCDSRDRPNENIWMVIRVIK